MDALDRPTIQRSAADLADDIKTRSAEGAAGKLQHFGGAEIAAALIKLSPGFAQDVLAALSDDARERALAAVPDEVVAAFTRYSPSFTIRRTGDAEQLLAEGVFV